MGQTQAAGATGLNACGSVLAAGSTPNPAGQNNFNLKSVALVSPGLYQLVLATPIPRQMGMIHVTPETPGLAWNLVSWTIIPGIAPAPDEAVIEINFELAGVATSTNFDFDVVQTNLDSANP